MIFSLVIALLVIATGFAGVAVLARRPRRIFLGWFFSGLVLSLYFLVLGFELLALANAFFVVASTIVIHLYASLYGTRHIAEAERQTSRGDWIHAIGTFLVLAAVIAFSISELEPKAELNEELGISDFISIFLATFPELTVILGFILFLLILTAATLGRPAWIQSKDSKKGSP